MPARFTVKQVADLTGVPAATLRAWERRYGVVAPQRSDSRYRLYNEDEVARLTQMAELVRTGTPASLAAERVAEDAAAARGTRGDPSPVVAEFTGTTAAPPIGDLILAAQHYDQALLTQVLDGALGRTSFETALEGWLMPALTELGHAWERGEIDVAGEHFVSAAVHRRLAAAFDAAGVNHGAAVTLVGLPPGALHQLGALSFAVCLRRQGVDVRFLGADVPHDSWAHSVSTLRPAGVIVSVPMPRDTAPARQLLDALAAEHPDVRLWVGGHGTDGIDAAEQLPPSAVQAARTVAAALLAR